MEQSELSESSGVARATVIDFEKGERSPRATTILAVRTALESAGVEFIPENGGGAGVRLKKERG
jgi:transcriptional regulator with XRE-family HTH domain